MTELRIAGVSHEAAKFAVEHWHYSRKLPAGKLVKVGAWEGDRFVGVVIFSRGATPVLGKQYGLTQAECVELTRVALAHDHAAPVSQVLSRAITFLRERNPGLRLIVSFADTKQGHHGGIYQATNWVYAGTFTAQNYIELRGELHHPRSLGAKYGVGGQSIPWLRKHVDPNARNVPQPPKHRYLMPLDRRMRRQIAKLAMPYPVRAVEASKEHAPEFRSGEAGSIPADRSGEVVTTS